MRSAASPPIHRAQRAEEALRQSEESTAFSSGVILFRLGLDVDISVSWRFNDAAVHNYGYSREEFLAMTLKDIARPDISQPWSMMSQSMRRISKRPLTGSTRKDGSVIAVEVTSRTLSLTGSAPDRARQRHHGAQTSRRSPPKAREEADRANCAKSDSFPLSHELRTPMNSISVLPRCWS